MGISRVLDLTGLDQGPDREPKARAFELFMLLHATARLWIWAWPVRSGRPEELGLAVGMSACLVFGLHAPSRRMAVIVAAVLLLSKQCVTFPLSSNHSFIECVCMTLLAVFGTRTEEGQRSVLQGVRSLAVIVFFYSGVQKVAYGTYFDGQYLAYSIANHSRFLSAFGNLIPDADLARLRALRPVSVGSGPFLVNALWFSVLSNIVWIFEIAAPVLLLIPRTRTLACAACLAFVVAIEVGAREFMFGGIYVNLLVLFLPFALNRLLLPFIALAYLFLVGVDVGWFPDFYFN